MPSCVVVEKPGGFKSLAMRDSPSGIVETKLSGSYVEIRVLAVSLNFRDVVHIQRLRPKNLPFIPCSDCVGRIVAVGSGCTERKLGERVCALFFPFWENGRPRSAADLRGALGGANALEGGITHGVLQERIRVPESYTVRVPECLSDAEASTLPCAGLTAWSALFGGYEDTSPTRLVGKGDIVLLEGTGGVSLLALQMAKALECSVIITSSQNSKLNRARDLGADACINYKETPKWGKKAFEIAKGFKEEKDRVGGVDLVVDVGGAGTISDALDAVRVGGRVMLVGNLGGRDALIKRMDRIFYKAITIQGLVVGHKKGFEAMCQFIEEKRVKPIVDKVFLYDEYKEAFEYLVHSKSRFGKVVIRVAGPKDFEKEDHLIPSKM